MSRCSIPPSSATRAAIPSPRSPGLRRTSRRTGSASARSSTTCPRSSSAMPTTSQAWLVRRCATANSSPIASRDDEFGPTLLQLEEWRRDEWVAIESDGWHAWRDAPCVQRESVDMDGDASAIIYSGYGSGARQDDCPTTPADRVQRPRHPRRDGHPRQRPGRQPLQQRGSHPRRHRSPRPRELASSRFFLLTRTTTPSPPVPAPCARPSPA